VEVDQAGVKHPVHCCVCVYSGNPMEARPATHKTTGELYGCGEHHTQLEVEGIGLLRRLIQAHTKSRRLAGV
jgi:hypothetical protein